MDPDLEKRLGEMETNIGGDRSFREASRSALSGSRKRHAVRIRAAMSGVTLPEPENRLAPYRDRLEAHLERMAEPISIIGGTWRNGWNERSAYSTSWKIRL